MKKKYYQHNKTNINKEKLIWEQKIRKVVKLYKEFMRITSFPDFDIKFVVNSKIHMEVINDKKTMVLSVNWTSILNKDFDYISTLFHEFTHMHDNSTLLLDKEEKYRKSALKLYTEYHASYIQALYLAGVSDVNNSKMFKINFDKLCERIDREIIEIELRTKIYSEDNSIENFCGVIDYYMYYYGSLVAYNKYSNNYKEIQTFDFELDEPLREFFKVLELNMVTDKLFELAYKIQTAADEVAVLKCLENYTPQNNNSNLEST